MLTLRFSTPCRKAGGSRPSPRPSYQSSPAAPFAAEITRRLSPWIVRTEADCWSRRCRRHHRQRQKQALHLQWPGRPQPQTVFVSCQALLDIEVIEPLRPGALQPIWLACGRSVAHRRHMWHMQRTPTRHAPMVTVTRVPLSPIRTRSCATARSIALRRMVSGAGKCQRILQSRQPATRPASRMYRPQGNKDGEGNSLRLWRRR
jgi:hypothetical protein